MSKIRRYRLRELCAPTDLETLNTAGADLLGHAVYENAECVLFFDHDAAIAAKDAEIERLRAALRDISKGAKRYWREGEDAYQFAILADAALKEGT